MRPGSLEGQMLGKYRVLEPLGRGGMARVYRAYHPQLDRYVAIKALRSDLVDDEKFLTRFRREAQAVASLRHPNIVQVFDFDVQDDVYYMVMELLEGDTLKLRLNDHRVRDEKMPSGETVRILLDVLDGLAYAHSEGMIHRDIKSANILLTGRGQAVITDFGIAQIVGGTRYTVSGALMGTLNYMAPEQGMEGQSDARSDIYSLGIVFYEMLTQRTPFEADTPLAILMKHLNDPLPLPRRIDPAIPEPFERVVLKALAKDPDDRYQSAQEMAQALREAADEAGIEPPPRISLPLSFTTPEAPSESVAVLSGSAREKITDAGFADDETDTTLGQRLAAESAEGAQALGQAGKELLSALGTVAHVAISKTASALRKAADAAQSEIQERSVFGTAEGPPEAEPASADMPPKERPEAQPAAEDVGETLGQRPAAEDTAGDGSERAAKALARRRAGMAILGAIGIVGMGNLCLLTVAAPTGYWQVFEQGWPIELFLASWGLCAIMYVTSSIWLLIPIGITLGTGVILAYCASTGNWDHWNFLWFFETWIVILSILVPIWLARGRNRARGLSRLLALLLSLISIAWIVIDGVMLGLGGLIAAVRGAFGP